jgi:hypothetical protein
MLFESRRFKMNKRRKWISLAVLISSLSISAHADEARDCKQMSLAQARMHASVKLLTHPSSALERVDVRSESAALNIAGIKLRVLGANGRCGMSLARVTPEIVTVKYTSPLSTAAEDRFELSKEREILSWRHVNKKRLATVYNFGPSGEVMSASTDEENL